MRKTPSVDIHIIKSNSVSQTLRGGSENTYWRGMGGREELEAEDGF